MAPENMMHDTKPVYSQARSKQNQLKQTSACNKN